MYQKRQEPQKRILNLLFDQGLGKPEQRVQLAMPTCKRIDRTEPRNNTEEAALVEGRAV
jgi:hypothetical protein